MTAEDTGSLVARLSRGIKATLVAQVLRYGSNIVFIVLLTRFFLTPEGFGQFFFALAVLEVIRTFASLGLPKSAARYVNEYAETDETQVRHVMRTSLLTLGILVGTVSVLLATGSGPLAALLGQPSMASFLFVGAGLVAARSATGYLQTLFQGFNRITMSATVTSLASVSRVLFAIGFIVAGFGAIGALLGYVVGYTLAAAIGGAIMYRQYYTRFDEADEPEAGLSRRLLEYSVPLTATKGANVLDKRVDSILVGALLNPTAVGFYTIGRQVSTILSTPAGSLGFTISPAYSEQRAGNRPDRAARLYETALRYVLVFYIPACAGLVLVAGPTVRMVFGPDYTSAVPVVQIFAGYILVNAINKITNDGLDFLGRARSRAYIQTGTGVGNFLLNLVLIPTMGVVGAAVATVITYSFLTLGNVYVIYNELPLKFGHIGRDLAIIGLITLGMAGVVLTAIPYVSGPLTLAGVVGLGGAIWAVLSILSGVLDVRTVRTLLL